TPRGDGRWEESPTGCLGPRSEAAGHLQPGTVGIVLDDLPAIAGVGEAEALVEGARPRVLRADVQGDHVGVVLPGPVEDRLGELAGDARVARLRGDPHGLELALVGGGVLFVAHGDDGDGLAVLDGEEPRGFAHALLPDLVLVRRFPVPALPEGLRIGAEGPETDLAHERPVVVVGADDFGHGCPPEPSLRRHGPSGPGDHASALPQAPHAVHPSVRSPAVRRSTRPDLDTMRTWSPFVC